MSLIFSHPLFQLDGLAISITLLAILIGSTTFRFAAVYLTGDRRRRQFLALLTCLSASIGLMAAANHLVLLALGFGAANRSLVLLLRHESKWGAAQASAYLSSKSLGLSWISLCLACALLAFSYQTLWIEEILPSISQTPMPLNSPAALLLVFAALAQSAVWPFHRWLLSSLNAPTPVSALMHAGVVNGGGFLLIRFSPLLLAEPAIMQLLFLLGMLSAFTATYWKLIQPTVKGMLACSTVSQMGFMLAQCGMGLFCSALAHLVWHGVFKAYLFLSSGQAAQEVRSPPLRIRSATQFCLCLVGGILGSYGYCAATGVAWLTYDTSLLLQVVAGLVAARATLSVASILPSSWLPLSTLIGGGVGMLHGASVALIELSSSTLHTEPTQPLQLMHLVGIAGLVMCALAHLLEGHLRRFSLSDRLYVIGLNASQADPRTLTLTRDDYAVQGVRYDVA